MPWRTCVAICPRTRLVIRSVLGNSRLQSSWMKKSTAPRASTSSSEPTEPLGDVQEFETFDDAVAALYAQLEPGGSIDLHDEDCALSVDGPECTCTPLRLTSGASA